MLARVEVAAGDAVVDRAELVEVVSDIVLVSMDVEVDVEVVEDSVVELSSVLVEDSSSSSSSCELVLVVKVVDAIAGGMIVFTDAEVVFVDFALAEDVLVSSPRPSTLSTALVKLSSRPCRGRMWRVGAAFWTFTSVIFVLTMMKGCAAARSERSWTVTRTVGEDLMFALDFYRRNVDTARLSLRSFG